MAYPEYANKQESLSKYSGPSKSDPFYWQGRGRTPIGTPGPMPSWAGNVTTGAQQYALEQGAWSPYGGNEYANNSSSGESYNSNPGTTNAATTNVQANNKTDQDETDTDEVPVAAKRIADQLNPKAKNDSWSIIDATIPAIKQKEKEMTPEQYTLSGQTLANDDYAGIAMSKYLSGNSELSKKYGDNWGKLQGEGTYDEWQDVLSDPSLAIYFTDITGDKRFQGDDGWFDFDKYWEYTDGLNPQNISSYDYDDFKLLNGTSAGALYSFYDYIAPDLENNTPGYKYYIDEEGYTLDDKGRILSEEGDQVFQIGEDGHIYDMYNRVAPVSYNYEDTRNEDEDYLNGLTHSEYTNLLLAAALANSVDLGVDASRFSEDEIKFLNELELASPYLNPDYAVNAANGAALTGNPFGVGYEQMLDKDIDFFGEYNPYMADYRVLTGVNNYPAEMAEGEHQVKSGKEDSPGLLDPVANVLTDFAASFKDDTK